MRVLVTGIGGPTGRGLTRHLLRAGVDVVGTDTLPVRVRRGVTRHRVPEVGDPDYVPSVLRLMNRESVDLVIPTRSAELPALADLDDRIAVSTLAAVQVAGDRWLGHRALAQALVPVPRTALPAHLNRKVQDWIGRPCVVKPRVGGSGRGVRLYQRSVAKSRLSEADLVSEYVPGTEYCANLYVADDPRDDVVVVLRTVGPGIGRAGQPVRVVRDDSVPGVGLIARSAARAAKLTGPVDVVVRTRANGRAVVVELRARFGATIGHAPEVVGALLTHMGSDVVGSERALVY